MLCSMEADITGDCGILFRFLDFVRCYVKPKYPFTKHLCLKIWTHLLKFACDTTGSAVIYQMVLNNDKDLNRTLIHHVVDIGLDEDITLDLLDVTQKFIHNSTDSLGSHSGTPMWQCWRPMLHV